MKLGFFATVALFAFAFPAGACTSWLLGPETTESGMMILHKIVDGQYSPRDADIRTSPNGWRWLRIGGYHGGHSNMALNEKGVAITTNGGDPNILKHPRGGRIALSCGPLEAVVMRNCATAAEGAEMLKNIARSQRFMDPKDYGFILMVADARQAFVVEICDGYAEVAELHGGIHVVANAWRLPGGEEFTNVKLSGIRGNRARERCASESLRQSRVDGKYTVRGCIETSRKIRKSEFAERFPFVPGDSKSKNMSVEAACFEIDPEFPAYLSCAYTTVGPPLHTVYLPISMAVEQLPEKIRDGRWAKMAYAHQAAFGPEHGDLPKFSELEDKFLAEFAAARDQARKLLREGKKDEAVKLLNECFDRQYAEADKLMTSLHAAAAEKSNASSD